MSEVKDSVDVAVEETPVAEAPAAAPVEDAKGTKNTLACISYIPMLFFLPYLGDHKNDPVAKNSSQQGLTLLAIYIIIQLFNSFVGYIPLISGLLRNAISIVQIALSICIIIGMIRAYNNKIWKLPLVGNIDIMKKIKGE